MIISALFNLNLTDFIFLCLTRRRLFFLRSRYAHYLSQHWLYFISIGYRWSCLATITDNTLSLVVNSLFFKIFKRFEDLALSYQALSKHMWLILEKPSLSHVNARRKIIVSIYILMGISIYFAPLLPVKIALGCLTVFITYYLFKVIPDKEQLKKS